MGQRFPARINPLPFFPDINSRQGRLIFTDKSNRLLRYVPCQNNRHIFLKRIKRQHIPDPGYGQKFFLRKMIRQPVFLQFLFGIAIFSLPEQRKFLIAGKILHQFIRAYFTLFPRQFLRIGFSENIRQKPFKGRSGHRIFKTFTQTGFYAQAMNRLLPVLFQFFNHTVYHAV